MRRNPPVSRSTPVLALLLALAPLSACSGSRSGARPAQAPASATSGPESARTGGRLPSLDDEARRTGRSATVTVAKKNDAPDYAALLPAGAAPTEPASNQPVASSQPVAQAPTEKAPVATVASSSAVTPVTPAATTPKPETTVAARPAATPAPAPAPARVATSARAASPAQPAARTVAQAAPQVPAARSMPTLDQPNIDRLKPAPAPVPATSSTAATPATTTTPAAAKPTPARPAFPSDRPLPTLDNPSIDRANPNARVPAATVSPAAPSASTPATSAPPATAGGREPVPGINAPGRTTDAPRAGSRALPTLTDPRGTGASPATAVNPTAAPSARAAGMPAWWVDKPTIDEGVVRVSASGDAPTEREARRLALDAGRRRLTQALGFAPTTTETERIEVVTLPSGSVRVLVLVSAPAKP